MSLPFTLAGEALQLRPDRTIYWPRARTLLVADVHLGKGAALRRAGVAVPLGGTRDDLVRLAAAIEATGAERLLVLGDFFHTHLDEDSGTREALESFRHAHRTLTLAVVRGNHDRSVERQPPEWRIVWHADGLCEPPFVFRHAPATEQDPRGYGLAGHLHPVVRLRGGQDGLRLPVFWFSHVAQQGVLPAFGALTGGYPVRPAPQDAVAGVTPDGLVWIPRALLSSRAHRAWR